MFPPLQPTSFIGRFLRFASALLPLAACVSCQRAENPQATFEHARQAFVHGDLARSQKEAEAGVERFKTSSPEWAWKFRILAAEAMLWRGMYQEALKQLSSGPPPPNGVDFALPILTLEGAAHAKRHQFAEAKSELDAADQFCRAVEYDKCGDVLRARGVLANERGQSAEAKRFFAKSSAFAKAHGDAFLESTALVNLGAVALQEEHFGEAVDWSQAAHEAALSLDAKDVAQTSMGNLGWAYYRLGDPDRAMELFLEAEKVAALYGDLVMRVSWLTNIGYVQMDAGNYQVAERSYEDALKIARQLDARLYIFNGLRALAKVSVQLNKLDQATRYADEAIEIAQKSGDRVGELYPLLVKGQVAARLGDMARAENIFREVEGDPQAPAALVWGAQHALAQLHEGQGKKTQAEEEYRAALSTFERARSALEHEDSKLPFVTNASRIYGDYINFLVGQGKIDQALSVADYSRARTLAEGLGHLRKGTSFAPESINAPLLARKSGGSILFYWLGEKQSYLWTITPQKTSVAKLAPAAEINATALRYRKALLGPLDVLDNADDAGTSLYEMLVAPSGVAFPKDSKVYVIPDGGLNSLNFETLLAPGPKLHYWIEDVTVVNASSLRLMESMRPASVKPSRKLLLVGDPAPADSAYPPLSNASGEIEGVRKHFPDMNETVIEKDQATPVAYLKSGPEQFGYIHFVAHGTASRLSPLDSAVVLSRATAEEDSFKLYARDIVKHPLRAELVTISTCYGSGSRAYSGEGLVGLSWAFLRAGAHNVIGALWEVSDVSTPGLMEQMYGELEKGRSPESALRDAKLGMLHSGTVYRQPFYWAPFQIYTGS